MARSLLRNKRFWQFVFGAMTTRRVFVSEILHQKLTGLHQDPTSNDDQFTQSFTSFKLFLPTFQIKGSFQFTKVWGELSTNTSFALSSTALCVKPQHYKKYRYLKIKNQCVLIFGRKHLNPFSKVDKLQIFSNKYFAT